MIVLKNVQLVFQINLSQIFNLFYFLFIYSLSSHNFSFSLINHKFGIISYHHDTLKFHSIKINLIIDEKYSSYH